MLLRFHRTCHHYVIDVVIIIVTFFTLSVTGSGSGGACSTLIGTYLQAAYKCAPGEFHESVSCEWDRLRLSCPKTKYLVIHSAQIHHSSNPHPHCSSRLTHSTIDDHAPRADCPAVCVSPLFINPCQGRRRCSVDTGSKRFRVASTEACRPPNEARPKRSINVIYTCVVKSLLRSVFSNSTHHPSQPPPDPCPSSSSSSSVSMVTQSSPFRAKSASVTRKPSLRPRSQQSSSVVVVMVTPGDAVAAAAVERDDDDEQHQPAGPATELLSEEADPSTQLVSLRVTTESTPLTSQSEFEAEETETMDHGFIVSLATVVMTTEDTMTTPRTTAPLNWSTLWFNHLSSDWTWSYHFISENKEKFFLYLALAISLGFIFILFAIVLRLSFRKPQASDPTDSPTHRCRCAGSLSPKADPGGSSARQPLTMSCTSPITWRLPDIDPSIAGDERPGRGCEIQLTSFNRLNSLPRVRRDSIVDVPPPPSPVSSTADHVHLEQASRSDTPPSCGPPEALVSTTATISRSNLNFIDNQSFGQAPRPPLMNMVSRPVTTVVILPLTTTDASVKEASTAFTGTGNGTAVVGSDSSSSSNQFYEGGHHPRDTSLGARVSVRPMAKFGSFGRTQGGSPCGQEYRELRQFSKTLQLPPGNHYFCT